jgi:uncharacterized coiled-coil DUF342 family protein
MPGRVTLSEEEEQAERAGRDRLDAIDRKLAELYAKRQATLTQARQLSDEQRDLAERREPKADAVEQAHRRHRDLGLAISANRRARDAARRALDEAVADLREHHSKGPKGERPRPELLKREMAELELRQQTHALKLDEENALIKHLRELRKQLDAVEKEAGQASSHAEKSKQLDEGLRSRRAELERIQKEGDQLRNARDAQMGSVQSLLVEAGGLYADLRAKAKARGEAMGRLDALSKEIYLLEAEGNRILRESKTRRFEAQKSVKDYNRTVRENVSGRDVLARTADAQFEELLKRGRITLGGGSGT